MNEYAVMTVTELRLAESGWVNIRLESGAYEVVDMRLSTREPERFPLGARFRVTMTRDDEAEG